MHKLATIPCSQTIAEHAQYRRDAWGPHCCMRVTNVVDLLAAKAKYHHSSHLQFFLKITGQRRRGKSEDVEKATAFKLMCQYLEDTVIVVCGSIHKQKMWFAAAYLNTQ